MLILAKIFVPSFKMKSQQIQHLNGSSQRHFACRKQGQQHFFYSKKCHQILISGTFQKILFTKANLKQIFWPKGKPQDLEKPCFPYNFCPSFIPHIGFMHYSSKHITNFHPTVRVVIQYIYPCGLFSLYGLETEKYRNHDKVIPKHQKIFLEHLCPFGL